MSKQLKTTMVFVFLIACASIAGCKKSSVSGLPGVESYPLATGNAWEYTRQFYIFNFRPIQPGATIPLDTFQSTVRVEILGQSLIRDSILTWKFQSSETEDSSTYAGLSFYRSLQDSLFLYAYTGGSLVVPVPQFPQAVSIRFGGKMYTSVRELLSSLHTEIIPPVVTVVDTFYEEHPPKSFVFPLRVGNRWTYRQRGYPWRMDRSVIGLASIQTPAGLYPAYRIRWYWDINDDGQWDPDIEGYDYVSNQGVLSRIFEIRNVIAVGPNSPDTLGYFDVRDGYTITSMSLN